MSSTGKSIRDSLLAGLKLSEFGKRLPLAGDPGELKPILEPRTPQETADQMGIMWEQMTHVIDPAQTVARFRRPRPTMIDLKQCDDHVLIMEMLERGYIVQKIQGGED